MQTSTANPNPFDAHQPIVAGVGGAQENLLKIEIPSMPQSMVEISIALADEDPDLTTLSRIIGRDMALSSAIMRTLNSPLFSLSKRVRNVQDAITYLGIREVASQTFQHSLRSVFPPSKHLDLIMGRATLRALIMGRLAQLLDMPEPWSAHASGIFEECGKAVFLRVKGEPYERMLTDFDGDDAALRDAEIEAFGIGHDTLSSQLCAKWGVAEEACKAIKFRIETVCTGRLPADPDLRDLAFLQIVAAKVMYAPVDAITTALLYSAEIGRTDAMVTRMVQKMVDQVAVAE